MLREREALIKDLFEQVISDSLPPDPIPIVQEQEQTQAKKQAPSNIIKFFNELLQKANDAQIEIFKAVMESPGVQTIKALMSIPFIPKMLKELRENETKEAAERLNNMTDQELCEEMSKRYNITFQECLKERMKHNQNIGPTQ